MRTLYLVQQIHWTYDDQWHYADGAIPQKAFVSRDAAEAMRAEKENAARDALVAEDPGDDYGYWSQNLDETFGSYDHITSLPSEEMDKRLGVLGLPPYVHDGNAQTDWNNGWWRNLWATATTPEIREVI